MIRYFVIFVLLKSFLFGCSLCSVYTPKTDVTTKIIADNENIKTLNVGWTFAQEFTDELLKIYDLNLDGTFNKKELDMIEDSLLDYLKPKNYITKIYYDNNKENEKPIPFEVKSSKMGFKTKDKTLFFEYSIDLNYKIGTKKRLAIKIFDTEGYFFVIYEDKNQHFEIPYKFTKSTNINEVEYILDISSFSVQEEVEPAKEEKFEEVALEEKVEEKVESAEFKQVKEENFLDKFTHNIKKYLLEIEKGEDKFALAFLLFASFVYGILHALGPGHGKAIAFSYFSSAKSSYFEAFIISLITAFVHIIGSLLLVVISIFVLQNILNSFIEDSISYITGFSAVIIMLLALYILYKKLTRKNANCCSCALNLGTTQFTAVVAKNSDLNFVKVNQNIKFGLIKRSKRQDLIFVLMAGIVPCAGTILLFVYAFLLKTYFAVILASISISLGMALVIFASSFLGVSLHKVSSKSKNIVNILEIMAPIIMFIFALILLLNSGNL